MGTDDRANEILLVVAQEAGRRGTSIGFELQRAIARWSAMTSCDLTWEQIIGTEGPTPGVDYRREVITADVECPH